MSDRLTTGKKVGYQTADLSIAVGVASEYPYDKAPVAEDDPDTMIKSKRNREKRLRAVMRSAPC